MFKIIYEDKYILIIDKFYNLVVSFNNNDNLQNITLINLLKEYYPKLNNITRNGLVHRIDKDTTGLLVICKTEYSFNEMKKKFINKEIIKKYLALVCGDLLSGNIIDIGIIKNKKSKSVSVSYYGKKSITHFRIIKRYNICTYIKIIPTSGRTHQIRAHMSYINNPIIFDYKYGYNISSFTKVINYIISNKLNINRQLLHSYLLTFKHPIYKKFMHWISNIPYDIKNFINILENIENY